MVLGWTIKIPVMMIKLHQPTPIETRNSVAFFEDVSDMYDPTSDWLDGMIPAHPSFGKDAQIQDILTSVKGFLLNKILDGCLELGIRALICLAFSTVASTRIPDSGKQSYQRRSTESSISAAALMLAISTLNFSKRTHTKHN